MREHRHSRVSTVLALILAVCAGLSAWCFLMHRVLTDCEVYTARAAAAAPERRARFEERVREIAAEVGFNPQTALYFYPAERTEAIAAEGAAWALSLVNGTEAPAPDVSARTEVDGEVSTLADAIFADPEFNQPRRVARDQGQAAVEAAAERELLPLRAGLLRMAQQRLTPLAGRLRSMVDALRPAGWILAALAALAGALLLLRRGEGRSRVGFLGAGMLAGGIGGAAILLPLHGAGIPEAVREVSEAFAAEVSGILGDLAGRHLLLCGLLAAAGLILFILGRSGGHGNKDEA